MQDVTIRSVVQEVPGPAGPAHAGDDHELRTEATGEQRGALASG